MAAAAVAAPAVTAQPMVQQKFLKNLTLTPRMPAVYRPLRLEYAILDTPEDTLQRRILTSFFRSLGNTVSPSSMEEAEDILLELLRRASPQGIDGVQRSQLDGAKRLPDPIARRLANALQEAYVSAANDDPRVRDAILLAKTPTEGKTTTLWNRYPEPVPSAAGIVGFRNALYTTYSTPATEGKRPEVKRISGKRNLINIALERAYEELVTPAEDDDGEVEPPLARDEPSMPRVEESPATVFAREITRGLGFRVLDDGSLDSTGVLPTPTLLSTSYQTERGAVLAQYPDMILPGAPDIPIVVVCETLGRLLASTGEATEQGDIALVRKEIQGLVVDEGKERALRDSAATIPSVFTVSTPFDPFARRTYLHLPEAGARGHTMRPIREVLSR